MEVLPDRVTILADTAERADEIDEGGRTQHGGVRRIRSVNAAASRI